MIVEALQSFFQNGFESLFIERLFWIGVFPILVIAIRLEERFRPLPKLVDLVSAAFVFGWLLAWLGRAYVVLFHGHQSLIDRISESFGDWPIIVHFAQLLGNMYANLDAYLFPFTDYILLVGPLILLSLIKEGRIKPKILKVIFNSWVIASLLGLGAFAVTVVVDNPASALLFGAMIPIINLYGFSTSIHVRKRYATDTFFRGFKIASGYNESGRMSEIIRGLTLVLAITAFWFHLSIAPDTLTAFYSTVIGGLLAIVGFAALVFTFTHERLPSPSMGRQIGADTRASQKAAGATLMCATVGLLLVDDTLTLNLRSMDLLQTIRATILFVAMVGFVYAIDGALVLFRHVVELMVEVDTRDTSLTVIFEEGQTESHLSANNKGNNGHSQMRDYLEEAGCKTLIATEATWVGILSQKNPILLLGRRSLPYPVDVVPGFARFVEQGGILVILTDGTDLHTKDQLLAQFNLQVLARDSTHWGTATIRADLEEETFFRDRHNAFISLLLHPAAGDEILVETASSGGDFPFVPEPLVYSHSVGKGKVIVVGSLYLFSNQNLQKHRTYRLLDVLAESSIEHFVQNNVETNAHSGLKNP